MMKNSTSISVRTAHPISESRPLDKALRRNQYSMTLACTDALLTPYVICHKYGKEGLKMENLINQYELNLELIG